FEIAEYQRRAILLGQAGQFLIERFLQFASGEIVQRRIGWCRDSGRVGIPFPPPRGGRPCFESDTTRGLVQAAGQGLAPSSGAGPRRQYDKGRLDSILRVVDIPQRAAADVVDHRSVPSYQGRERRFIALLGETAQQLVIGDWLRRPLV